MQTEGHLNLIPWIKLKDISIISFYMYSSIIYLFLIFRCGAK